MQIRDRIIGLRRVRASELRPSPANWRTHPDAPIDKESRAEMQRHVDRYYRMFVESVARNRGTTVERVESEFGQGRIVGATDAVRRGMADRVGTFEDVVRDVAGRVSARDRLALRRRRMALCQ